MHLPLLTQQIEIHSSIIRLWISYNLYPTTGTYVYNLYVAHICMTSCPPGTPFTWHSFRSSLLRCSVAMANNLRLLVDSRRALAETSWAETSVPSLIWGGHLQIKKKDLNLIRPSKHCSANCIAICRIY